MKLFRFMSKGEFDKLLRGEKLVNNTKHNALTDSIGFCFMKGEESEAEYSYGFLSGIVSEDVVVLFETNDKLKKGHGVYADPNGSFYSTIIKEEYSIKEYDKDTIKPLKYCTNYDVAYFCLFEGNRKWHWKDIKLGEEI